MFIYPDKNAVGEDTDKAVAVRTCPLHAAKPRLALTENIFMVNVVKRLGADPHLAKYNADRILEVKVTGNKVQAQGICDFEFGLGKVKVL